VADGLGEKDSMEIETLDLKVPEDTKEPPVKRAKKESVTTSLDQIKEENLKAQTLLYQAQLHHLQNVTKRREEADIRHLDAMTRREIAEAGLREVQLAEAKHRLQELCGEETCLICKK
jgi:hypothetical protein